MIHPPQPSIQRTTPLRGAGRRVARRIGWWAVLGATVMVLVPLEIWSLRRARRRLRTLQLGSH